MSEQVEETALTDGSIVLHVEPEDEEGDVTAWMIGHPVARKP